MDSFIVAVATDDGKNLIDRHFGDADYYYLYRVSKEKQEFLKSVSKKFNEDESLKDGDPEKAKGISAFLKPFGVKVTAAKAYGPNIKRIKKHFVCVLANGNIQDALNKIQENFPEVEAEWEKGGERNYLTLRS